MLMSADLQDAAGTLAGSHRSGGTCLPVEDSVPESFDRPSGYDPVLAHQLTLLLAAASARCAGMPAGFPAPYLAAGDIEGAWPGTICVGPDAVAVVFPDSLVFPRTVDWTRVQAATRFVAPEWLAARVAVAEPFASAYAAMRGELRARLVNVRRGDLAVHFAGHGSGGVLASLAALDLAIAAELGAPLVGGVYTFGSLPAGDHRFAELFASVLGTMSFHVVRPRDPLPDVVLGRAIPLPRRIVLPGGFERAEHSGRRGIFHALDGYTALLDPRGGAEWDVEARVSPVARAHYQAALAEREIVWASDVHKCPLDSADSCGRMVFTWDRVRSDAVPSRYGEDVVHLAMQRIVVRAGHELVIEAPHDQEVHVIAAELLLGPGARVRITTSASLHVGVLRAVPALEGASHTSLPCIEVAGRDGTEGFPGGAGPSGAHGGPGQSGTSGGDGAGGGAGQPGLAAPWATIDAAEVRGRFVIRCRGGAGGSGGAGGVGGAGGDGGSLPDGYLAAGGDGASGGNGGPGGAGGYGGRVLLTYRTLAEGTEIIRDTPASRGGCGGVGGAGGRGGAGSPRGSHGTPAATGPPGAPGFPGTVIIEQRP